MVRWWSAGGLLFVEQRHDERHHAGARPPATKFKVDDRSFVDPSRGSQFGLGQSVPASVSAESLCRCGCGRRRVAPQEGNDARPVANRGRATTEFPPGNRPRGDLASFGEDALREPEVEPALPDMVPERPRLARVTAWQDPRSGRI